MCLGKFFSLSPRRANSLNWWNFHVLHYFANAKMSRRHITAVERGLLLLDRRMESFVALCFLSLSLSFSSRAKANLIREIAPRPSWLWGEVEMVARFFFFFQGGTDFFALCLHILVVENGWKVFAKAAGLSFCFLFLFPQAICSLATIQGRPDLKGHPQMLPTPKRVRNNY